MRRTSSTEFLALRQEPCTCVSRNIKRRLQYFRIYVRFISTVVSLRQPSANKSSTISRCLPSARITVQRSAQRKLRRKRTPTPRFPSILLANVSSFSNKYDDVRMRTKSTNPDVVVLTESWLNEDIPDASIGMENYHSSKRSEKQRRWNPMLH